MAFGLGLGQDGGFATDTIEDIRLQAIEILTLDNMVDPMDDPVRSVLVQRLTDKIYQLQQVGLSVWNAMSVNNASRANLDLLAANLGIVRKNGIAQTITVRLTSVNVGAGYTIPVSTRFTTTDGKYTYSTLAAIEIDSDTPIEVSVQATINGNLPVVVGDKLVSQSYIPQLADVEIVSIDIEGLSDETDEELRVRFWGKSLSFIGTIPFMLDQLRGIDYLRKVGENHNNTSQTDADGVPAYSTEFLVLPYTDAVATPEATNAVKQAVAQTILSFMLPGLPTYGSTSIQIPDYKGKDRTINFTIVDSVPVQVFFQIAPKEDGTFSEASVPNMQQAIYDYINNLDIGTDISITQLWGIVSPNAPFEIVDFGIRRAGGQWQKTNLSIGTREAATISLENIVIGQDAGQ